MTATPAKPRAKVDPVRLPSWHIGVAAEAIAAAQFARCGFDVSVQYGANQPEYDLMVARGEQLLKVSVKGSQDGGWGLTQSFLKQANYTGAIDTWLKRHGARTALCFVQFKGVDLSAMPRLYLATPEDVAKRLRGPQKAEEILSCMRATHGAPGRSVLAPPTRSQSLGAFPPRVLSSCFGMPNKQLLQTQNCTPLCRMPTLTTR